MKVKKNSFEEYCPICWESMERQGTLNGKAVYICPKCGMVTDGGRDNGKHDKQLGANIHPL